MNDENRFLYRRSLSEPLSELFNDPFSELTRKRQVTLLISATIVLLLSVGLITVTEIDVTNAKITLSMPEIAKWLAFATTIYLLIIYLISVRADWTISKVKHWSPLASVADTKTAMKADEKARSEAESKRKAEIESLRIEKNKIHSEMRAQLDEILTRQLNMRIMLHRRSLGA